MGIKRPLEDEGFPEPSFSLPKPTDYNKRLNLYIEETNIGTPKVDFPGAAKSYFCEIHYDEPFEDGAYVADKELEASAPLSLVTSTSSEDDSGDGYTSFWPYFPENDFSKPRRPPEQYQNPYVSLLNGPPRKEIPVGPDYQAEIPMWQPNASMMDFSQELMGTCIIPMPDLNDSTVDGLKAGRGRTDCICMDMGSMRCVQQHVKEAREKLRESIGDETFIKLGFNEMGEEIALKWVSDDEQLFHEIVLSNRVIFWKHLRAEFPSRKMRELVSYYFNVFMLRRRAVQNRSFVLDIDSDDDEEQRDPQGDFYQNGSYLVDRDIGNNDDTQGQNGEYYFVGGDDDDDDSTVESFGDEDLDASWVDEFWSEPEKVDGDNEADKQDKQNNGSDGSYVEKKDAFEMDGRKDVIAGQGTNKVHDEPCFLKSST